MPIVVDANLVVALVSADAREALVERQFNQWFEVGERLHAPSLLMFEIASAFTRQVAAGQLPQEDLLDGWRRVDMLPIEVHALSHGSEVVEIALQLGRRSAYDAAYIQLARQLDAQLWTLDEPLYRNASQFGFPVQLIDV